ncbi:MULTISPECIES: hypothetical protein [Acinetobacter]|nr:MULTISPECIES: hypothetical protein [Acinetobacter]
MSSIGFQPSVEVLEKAQTALDLVLSDDSELNELWGKPKIMLFGVIVLNV